MAIQRRSGACVIGYRTLEETEVHCDRDYLIKLGECPNGHGEMEQTSRQIVGAMCQHCNVCNFFTNSRPQGEKPLAERIAPGEWIVRDPDRVNWEILASPDGGETVIDIGEITRPVAGDSYRAAHAELLLDAARTVQQTGLSPSELARLAVLLHRQYIGTCEPGHLRSVLLHAILRAAKERK